MTQSNRDLLKLEQITKERCRRSLYYFVKEVWPIIEPGEYYDNWHIEAICEHLMAVSSGEIKRLIINIPPRFMKSTLVAVIWPTWEWISHPETRWLFSSYALNLSIRDAQKSRRVLESAWFQHNWGDVVQLREDQNAKSFYENTRGGARLSISVGSAATGHGGDHIVVDDPHNAQEADSPIIREATLNWWSETMSSRLNNPKTGSFTVIMQRLHEKDLTGFLLAQGGYEHMCVPLEYEKKHYVTHITWTDVHGEKHKTWEDPRTREGELLWPERINDKTVASLKLALGAYGYASQYQQTPAPSGGGIIKKEWFRYCKVASEVTGDEVVLFTPKGDKHVPLMQTRLFITVDLASSLKEMADYTVVAVWAQTIENDLVLLDITRKRMEAHEQQDIIKQKYVEYHCEFIDVEASGYQLTMVQQLVRMGLPVRGYTPVRDKVSRARTASIRYQAGTIYHLQFASWLVDFEKELLGFPTMEHDDQVDVTSRAAEIVVGDVQPQIRDLNVSDEDLAAFRITERVHVSHQQLREEHDSSWEEEGVEIEIHL